MCACLVVLCVAVSLVDVPVSLCVLFSLCVWMFFVWLLVLLWCQCAFVVVLFSLCVCLVTLFVALSIV